MADEIDRAQECDQRMLEEALAADQVRRSLESAPVRSGATDRLCIDCQGEIPRKRLAAHPNAERCTECQQVHEQRQKRKR